MPFRRSERRPWLLPDSYDGLPLGENLFRKETTKISCCPMQGDDGTNFWAENQRWVEPLKKGILIGKKASIGVDDWLTFRERSEGWFGGSEVSKFLPLEKRQLIEDSKQTNFGKWVVLLLYGEIWYIESMNQVAINGNSVPFHPRVMRVFVAQVVNLRVPLKTMSNRTWWFLDVGYFKPAPVMDIHVPGLMNSMEWSSKKCWISHLWKWCWIWKNAQDIKDFYTSVKLLDTDTY